MIEMPFNCLICVSKNASFDNNRVETSTVETNIPLDPFRGRAQDNNRENQKRDIKLIILHLNFEVIQKNENVSVWNVFVKENETTRNLIWSSFARLKTKRRDANKMFYLLILSFPFFSPQKKLLLSKKEKFEKILIWNFRVHKPNWRFSVVNKTRHH